MKYVFFFQAEDGIRDIGVTGVQTCALPISEPSVVEDVEALAERLGKVDVTIGDRAGFIANALLFGYLNHAVSMYENRYATREDIDAAMRLGCGLPMGPLADRKSVGEGKRVDLGGRRIIK